MFVVCEFGTTYVLPSPSLQQVQAACQLSFYHTHMQAYPHGTVRVDVAYSSAQLHMQLAAAVSVIHELRKWDQVQHRSTVMVPKMFSCETRSVNVLHATARVYACVCVGARLPAGLFMWFMLVRVIMLTGVVLRCGGAVCLSLLCYKYSCAVPERGSVCCLAGVAFDRVNMSNFDIDLLISDFLQTRHSQKGYVRFPMEKLSKSRGFDRRF